MEVNAFVLVAGIAEEAVKNATQTLDEQETDPLSTTSTS